LNPTGEIVCIVEQDLVGFAQRLAKMLFHALAERFGDGSGFKFFLQLGDGRDSKFLVHPCNAFGIEPRKFIQRGNLGWHAREQKLQLPQFSTEDDLAQRRRDAFSDSGEKRHVIAGPDERINTFAESSDGLCRTPVCADFVRVFSLCL
jgi:hypothetical protein